jgi:DNA-directed RNA polymerase specialized sigma24 family protein
MHELRTDHELLAEFARTESETAFATLVERYVNLVYSTALRFTGNPHHAEEITQAVFIILARKAGKLSPRVVLSGWLYQAARAKSGGVTANRRLTCKRF